MSRYEVFGLLAHLLPLGAIVFAILGAVYEQFFKSESKGAKDFSWHMIASGAGLTLWLVTLNFAAHGDRREFVEASILEKLEGVGLRDDVRYDRLPNLQQIEDEICSRIEELKKGDRFEMHRATFHPISSPRPNARQDRFVADPLYIHSLPLVQVFGIPTLSSTQSDKTGGVSLRRRLMQESLFRFLTSERVVKMPVGKKGIRTFFAPSTLSNDVWTISTVAKKWSGLTLFGGTWSEIGGTPEPIALIQISDDHVSESFREDLDELIHQGIDYLRSQLELPSYEREPSSVFLMGDPGEGLTPLNIEELRRRLNERVAFFRNSYRQDGRPLPPEPIHLTELRNLVSCLEDQTQ